jgi:hypothetical protein
MKRVRRVFTLSMALAVLAVACKKEVGSSCGDGESRCVNRKTQLVCDDGKFIAIECMGPGGCVQDDKSVTCDFSGNPPGSPCAKGEEGAAVCVEEHRMIACRAGQFRSVPCRGPKGCENEHGHAMCDTSIGAPSDPCKEQGNKACSADGKDVLACTSGEMAIIYHCRGPEGCSSKEGKLECDMSNASLDDPCEKSMEGKIACNTDLKGIVVCKGGKFVADESCKAGTRCSSKGGSIECAKPG